MDISNMSIRTWAMLGQRGTFGSALLELAAGDPRLIAITADLCGPSGLERFRSAYPDRFINTGIAEQNLLGVAAGVADAGFVPFATTFANFASLRACEMVRHYMSYMRCNVKLVGLAAGFAMELFGNTHYGMEDVAVLRSMPNLLIISPAAGLETVKCVEAAAAVDGPVYLRLTGVMNTPIVYRADYTFTPGRAVILREGGDVALLAAGSMVASALKAAESLAEKGCQARVINMHTIKPLDQMMLDSCRGYRLIVSIEEHSVIGGLGTAVADALLERGYAQNLLKIGIPQKYFKAGGYEYMLSQAGLTVPQIVLTVHDHLSRM
jgi:transketolase